MHGEAANKIPNFGIKAYHSVNILLWHNSGGFSIKAESESMP